MHDEGLSLCPPSLWAIIDLGNDGPRARLYESAPHVETGQRYTTYYWCCEECGACSGHNFSKQAAEDSAADHLHNHQEA